MPFRIPIDRATIRLNPYPGVGPHFMPGLITETVHADGTVERSRQIIEITTLQPGPKWTFTYVPVPVTCHECGASFPWTDLQADVDTFDEEYSSEICPACGAWDCCDLGFETLPDDYKQ